MIEIKTAELTTEELAKITEHNVGVIELSDEMLGMVSGGISRFTFYATPSGCISCQG